MRHVRALQSSIALASALIFGACHGHHSYDDCGTCGPDYLLEDEPNDNVCCANFFGTVYPGESFEIRGHLGGLADDFDGFAFVTGAPCDVEVTLVHDLSGDLDFGVFDPVYDDFVASFETDIQPEWGLFSVGAAGREFHLVAWPFLGAGDYSMFVDVRPLTLAAETDDAAPAIRPAFATERAPNRAAPVGYQAGSIEPDDSAIKALVLQRGWWVEGEGETLRARKVELRADGWLLVED